MKPFRSLVRPSESSRSLRSDFLRVSTRTSCSSFRNGDAVAIPSFAQLEALQLDLGLETYLGDLDGSDLIAWELSERAEEFPDGWELAGLRSVYGSVDDQLFALAGRAIQLLDWRRNHLFCGRCGSPTELVDGDRATKCPNCGLFNYPRLSPAVIMTVEREGACLLAHGVNFQDGVYSCVAGFVEPGESLEEAVAREVREETGIEVEDVAVLRQPAVAVPELAHDRFQRHAMRAARSSSKTPRSAMPNGSLRTICRLLPGKISIARRLIDDWLERSIGAVLTLQVSEVARRQRSERPHDDPEPAAEQHRQRRQQDRQRRKQRVARPSRTSVVKPRSHPAPDRLRSPAARYRPSETQVTSTCATTVTTVNMAMAGGSRFQTSGSSARKTSAKKLPDLQGFNNPDVIWQLHELCNR